jgi:diguanylate cyclase (GGDEF)-like protein
VPHWRVVAGPLTTLVVAAAILLTDRYLIDVPNPGAIAFVAIAFAAYLGGVVPGLVSAAISVALAAVMFSIPGSWFDFTPDNFARVVVLTFCTPAVAVLIGVLQGRARRALKHERANTKELVSLRAALDQSEVGVVLLDSEMRAQFINRAFRRLWRLSDEAAARKPAFIELMYHGRNTKAFAVPDDKVDAYISEQTALIQAGDEKPVDIRRVGGNVLRSRCKVLTDGGRMMTYGDVSDLVRSAEDMAALALRDALTGIYNRRHFMARLDDEWKRFRRYERPMSMLMLDIDHFKSVNDRYGHDVGDQIIIAVAGVCGTQTRDSDVLARIGGEEFAILLPETNLKDAHVVAERLRAAVAAHPLASNAGPVPVTVSIGSACADSKALDPTALIKRADEALYAAKRSGRNCVAAMHKDGPVVYGDKLPQPQMSLTAVSGA